MICYVLRRCYPTHTNHLHQVYCRLQSAGLTLRGNNCHLCMSYCIWACFLSSWDGGRLKKTQVIKEWPNSKDAKDLHLMAILPKHPPYLVITNVSPCLLMRVGLVGCMGLPIAIAVFKFYVTVCLLLVNRNLA